MTSVPAIDVLTGREAGSEVAASSAWSVCRSDSRRDPDGREKIRGIEALLRHAAAESPPRTVPTT